MTRLAPKYNQPRRSRLAPRPWETRQPVKAAGAAAAATVPRKKNIFLWTKKWNHDHHAGPYRADDPPIDCEQCLTLIGHYMTLNDGSPLCMTCYNEPNF